MDTKLSIINQTKGNIPKLPFLAIKNEILGHDYDLSIAFVGKLKSKKLNNTWREKNYATNVLSFSLNKKSGELVLCPEVIKKETKKFNRNFRELLGFLVIHGMLHLKGMSHGAIMEKAEEKYDKKYFNGNRRRLFDYKSSRGRIHQGRKKS